MSEEHEPDGAKMPKDKVQSMFMSIRMALTGVCRVICALVGVAAIRVEPYVLSAPAMTTHWSTIPRTGVAPQYLVKMSN